MNPAAMLIAGVFSVCTPDGCVMGPPLKYFPPPMNVQRVAPRPYPPLSQDAEREFIIRQGQVFCDKYPKDQMCHWQDQQRRP